MCRDLLEVITQRDPNEKIEDPMCVHSILMLAKALNNKELLSNAADEKYLAQLINQFLKRVEFNRDLE